MKGDYSLYKTRSYANAWESLKENNPEIATKLGYWGFRKMLSDTSDIILEEVLTSRDGFDLPENLGKLQMIGVKITKKTKGLQYRKLSLMRTENVVYSLRWLKNQKHSNVNNIYYFNFKTSILVRKVITEYIRKDKFLKWLVLEHFHQIRHLKKYADVDDLYLKAKQKYDTR